MHIEINEASGIFKYPLALFNDSQVEILSEDGIINLYLFKTENQIKISQKIDVNNSKYPSTLIDGYLFKRFGESYLEIEEEERNLCKLISGNNTIIFPKQEKKEEILLSARRLDNEVKEWQFETNDLNFISSIKSCISFVDKFAEREQLKLISLVDNKIFALSGYHAIQKKIDIIKNEIEDKAILIPVDVANILKKIRAFDYIKINKQSTGGVDLYTISIDSNLFLSYTVEVAGNLIKSVDPFIKDNQPLIICSIERKDLVSLYHRLTLLPGNKTAINIFNVDENTLSIQCKDNTTDVVVEVTTSININVNEVNLMNIALNPSYVLDVLESLDDETILIEIRDEYSPVVFRDINNTNNFAIVLPIRVVN